MIRSTFWAVVAVVAVVVGGVVVGTRVQDHAQGMVSAIMAEPLDTLCQGIGLDVAPGVVYSAETGRLYYLGTDSCRVVGTLETAGYPARDYPEIIFGCQVTRKGRTWVVARH